MKIYCIASVPTPLQPCQDQQRILHFHSYRFVHEARDFTRPDLGPILAPPHLKKMVYINHDFLDLHFGKHWCISMKICLQMWMKTSFHSPFYANFHEFYEGQFKKQICYTYILLISHMVFNLFKMVTSSFRLHPIFPILMVQMLFSPNSTCPWPRLQKERKITGGHFIFCFPQSNKIVFQSLKVFKMSKELWTILRSNILFVLTFISDVFNVRMQNLWEEI